MQIAYRVCYFLYWALDNYSVLIKIGIFRGNWKLFSQYFTPEISVPKLKKVIRDLCEWKLIYLNGEGRYLSVDQFTLNTEVIDWQFVKSKDAVRTIDATGKVAEWKAPTFDVPELLLV